MLQPNECPGGQGSHTEVDHMYEMLSRECMRRGGPRDMLAPNCLKVKTNTLNLMVHYWQTM